MNSSELAELVGVTPRAVRKKTKQAYESGRSFVEFGGVKYNFRLQSDERGRSYEYSEEAFVVKEDRFSLVEEPMKKDEAVDKLEVLRYVSSSSVKSASIYYDIPEKTIYRWQSEFRKKGKRALDDKRGGNNKKILDEAIERAIYGAGSTHLTSVYHVYCMMYAKDNGLVIEDIDNPPSDISLSAFSRRFAKLKTENIFVRSFLARGLDGIKDAGRVVGIRNYLERGEEWQVDSTKVDFMALDEFGEAKRYTAIAVVDSASKERVWELFESSNSYAVVRALKKMMVRFGKPQTIKGDNGADYVSKHFRGVCVRLGIVYINCDVASGWQKGVVERGFRSVQHSWLENIPGFIGHNTGERIRIEAQAKEKVHKLTGVQTHKENLLTKDELQAVLDGYIDKKYNKNDLQTNENIDFRVLGKSDTLKLHSQGFKRGGFIYVNLSIYKEWQIGESFEFIQDIDDSSLGYIYKDDVFVCEVRDSRVVSITAEEVKEARKAHNKKFTNIKKAIAKDMSVIKDETYKSEMSRSLVKREVIHKEEAKELFIKNDDEVEIEIKVRAKRANMPEYMPSLAEALEVLEG